MRNFSRALTFIISFASISASSYAQQPCSKSNYGDVCLGEFVVVKSEYAGVPSPTIYQISEIFDNNAVRLSRARESRVEPAENVIKYLRCYLEVDPSWPTCKPYFKVKSELGAAYPAYRFDHALADHTIVGKHVTGFSSVQILQDDLALETGCVYDAPSGREVCPGDRRLMQDLVNAFSVEVISVFSNSEIFVHDFGAVYHYFWANNADLSESLSRPTLSLAPAILRNQVGYVRPVYLVTDLAKQVVNISVLKGACALRYTGETDRSIVVAGETKPFVIASVGNQTSLKVLAEQGGIGCEFTYVREK